MGINRRSNVFFRTMKKGLIAFVGMVLTLVLLVVVFLGPWYTIAGNGGALGVNYNYNIELFLTHMDTQGTFLGQEVSTSLSYAEARENAQQTGVNSDSFTVIDNVMILSVLAVLCAFIAVLCTGVFVFTSKKSHLMKYLGSGFGLFTCILCFVAILYFMSAAYTANNYGFWFSTTANIFGISLDLMGGPGYVWYIMIIAAVVAVISAGAILIKKITESSPELTSSTPK